MDDRETKISTTICVMWDFLFFQIGIICLAEVLRKPCPVQNKTADLTAIFAVARAVNILIVFFVALVISLLRFTSLENLPYRLVGHVDL